MTVENLDVITLKSIGKHSSTIIWLHGLGETRDGWTEIDLKLRKKFSSTKFLFPIAPVRNTGLYGNRELPSWFNITSRENIGKMEDEESLSESITLVEKLIEEEIKSGILPSNIILGGFSQGSMTTLALALKTKFELGGIILVSGYFKLEELERFSEFNQEVLKETPILMLQGEDDQGVPAELSVKLNSKLLELNYNVEFELFKGVNHEISKEMVDKINNFIENNIVKFDC